MSDYAGAKSLDAEVHIDLINNTIEMDYVLNAKGSPMESNTSTILKDDIKDKTTKKERRNLTIKRTIYACYFVLYEGFNSLIVTTLTEKGWIKNKVWLIEHQKIGKMLWIGARGKFIESKEGALTDKALTFWLSNNMWLQYFLEGDYEKEVSGISFTRHFEKRLVDNKYEIIKQHGWDLTFTFNNPPQSGSCRIEHT